jgi:hypothetical protein
MWDGRELFYWAYSKPAPTTPVGAAPGSERGEELLEWWGWAGSNRRPKV